MELLSAGTHRCDESLFSFLPPYVPLTTIDSALRFKGTSLRNTLYCAHGMYIVVLPTLVRGCWLYVECGSSASGRRRSLRYEVRALNLPQVWNLREVGDNRLHEGVGPTHGSVPTIY